MTLPNDQHRITTEAELEALYDKPVPITLDIILNFLDPHFKRLIGQARFFCLATASEDGIDVSPRGGEQGFVHIIDERTIAIPDFRGNNKLATLRNIVRSGKAGTVFLFPGVKYFMRINGPAHISRDPDLLDKMQVNGKIPKVAIVIETEEAFFHCGKAIVRSGVWQTDTWPAKDDVPASAQMLHDQQKTANIPADEIAALEEKVYREELY